MEIFLAIGSLRNVCCYLTTASCTSYLGLLYYYCKTKFIVPGHAPIDERAVFVQETWRGSESFESHFWSSEMISHRRPSTSDPVSGGIRSSLTSFLQTSRPCCFWTLHPSSVSAPL